MADGSFTIHASGGSTQLLFSIDTGNTQQSDSTFTGLLPGEYQILISDSVGVTITETFILYGTGGIISTALNIAKVTCFGDSDGQVDLQLSGGTPPYVYEHVASGVSQNTGLFMGLPGGSNRFAFTDDDYCTDSTDILVPEPAQLDANPTVTDENCPAGDGSIVFNPMGGNGVFQHSINNGGTYQPSPTFTSLTSGGYFGIVTDQQGCSDTVGIILNSAPGTGPLITSLNYVEPLCAGSDDGSITITATGTNPIEYSNDGGQNFQTGNTFFNLGPDTYIMVVQDGNGCIVGSVMNVTEPAPVQNTVVYYDETCVGNDGQIEFTVSGGTVPYSYSIDNGATTSATPVFSGLTGGTYKYLVADNNGCSDTGTVVLNTGGGPTINSIEITSPTCQNTTDGLIIINAVSQSAPILYSINGGVTTFPTDTFPNLPVGNYLVNLEDANGCVSAQVVTVGAPPSPYADASADPVRGIAPLDVNFYNESIASNAWFWNFGDTTNSTAENPSHTYTTPGEYNVVMTASDGLCTDTVSILIQVEDESSVEIPNVFTPNGDGFNDFFSAETIGISQMDGVIFNRWGEEVYKWEGPNGGWDGRTFPAGVACAEGTYFYVIKAITFSGEEQVYKGHVSLFRQNEQTVR